MSTLLIAAALWVETHQIELVVMQDIHFSAAGHALWASWLHEQLAATAPPS